MTHNKITPKMRKVLAEAYKTSSLSQMRDRFGIGYIRLRRALKAEGVEIRARWEKPVRGEDPNTEEIIRAYTEDNMSLDNIASKFSYTTGRVRALLTENGVEIRGIGIPAGKTTAEKVPQRKVTDDDVKRMVQMRARKNPATLADIGKKFGISRQRVHQLTKSVNSST